MPLSGIQTGCEQDFVSTKSADWIPANNMRE
jgi:hypothetical protein